MTTRDGRWADRRVLVVEDDYHVADSLVSALATHGIAVIGPIATVEAALAAIAAGGRIDGAVLDINLRGEMGYPVADLLQARGVPFVITTGYDRHSVKQRYPEVACFEKPAMAARLLQALFGRD
jgi:CheY-like chemotaxis protein